MDLNAQLINVSIVAILYIVLFIVTELWYRSKIVPVEKTRKLVHIVSGLIALSFGYLFESVLIVFFLCFTFAAILLITEKTGLLKSVHDVDRDSKGSLYFPLGVFIVFYIAQVLGKPEFYFLSILVLAVSDTLAALIGKKYGFKLYEVEENRKSLEGSGIFFLFTFLILIVGILLMTETGRTESILGALYIAILVTAIESISVGGSDNIFIPVSTIYILNKITTKPPEEIMVQVAAIFIIYFITYLLLFRRKKVSMSGIMGISLLGYAAFSLRGVIWYIPLIFTTLIVNYLDVFIPQRDDMKDSYKIVAVFYTVFPVLFWIIISNLYGESLITFYFPFTLSIIGILALMWEGRSREIKANNEQVNYKWFYHLPRGVRWFALSLVFSIISCLSFPEFKFMALLLINFFGVLLIDLQYWLTESKMPSKTTFMTFVKLRSLHIIMVTGIFEVLSHFYSILT